MADRENTPGLSLNQSPHTLGTPCPRDDGDEPRASSTARRHRSPPSGVSSGSAATLLPVLGSPRGPAVRVGLPSNQNGHLRRWPLRHHCPAYIPHLGKAWHPTAYAYGPETHALSQVPIPKPSTPNTNPTWMIKHRSAALLAFQPRSTVTFEVTPVCLGAPRRSLVKMRREDTPHEKARREDTPHEKAQPYQLR